MLVQNYRSASSLCHACDHSTTCSLKHKNESYVFDCHDFSMGTIQLNKNSVIEEKYNGLCSSCEAKDYCSLRSTDTVILNCEQYK